MVFQEFIPTVRVIGKLPNAGSRRINDVLTNTTYDGVVRAGNRYERFHIYWLLTSYWLIMAQLQIVGAHAS